MAPRRAAGRTAAGLGSATLPGTTLTGRRAAAVQRSQDRVAKWIAKQRAHVPRTTEQFAKWQRHVRARRASAASRAREGVFALRARYGYDPAELSRVQRREAARVDREVPLPAAVKRRLREHADEEQRRRDEETVLRHRQRVHERNQEQRQRAAATQAAQRQQAAAEAERVDNEVKEVRQRLFMTPAPGMSVPAAALSRAQRAASEQRARREALLRGSREGLLAGQRRRMHAAENRRQIERQVRWRSRLTPEGHSEEDAGEAVGQGGSGGQEGAGSLVQPGVDAAMGRIGQKRGLEMVAPERELRARGAPRVSGAKRARELEEQMAVVFAAERELDRLEQRAPRARDESIHCEV